MSENQKPKALSGVKEAWANPKARKGILLTAGIAGVVLVVTGMSLKNNGNSATGVSSSAKVAAPPVVRPDVTAKVTPEFQNMVIENDSRKSEGAKSGLGMSLPNVAGLSQITEAPKPVAPSTNFAQPAGAPAPAPQNVQQLNAQSEAQARAQLEAQIRANPQYAIAGAFMTSAAQQMNAGKSPFGVILAPQSRTSGAASSGVSQNGAAGSPGSAGSSNSTAQGGIAAIAPTVLIGGGTALFATMDTAINSDYSGPVVATIRQGPYKDARLIGTKSLEFEAVVLRFTMMSPPNGGASIPINAYAINLGDVSQFGTTGLQGNVDYHIMKRYVLPAILAFGQTYGYAASVTGTSTTSTDAGVTQETTPLSSKDRAIVALGGALAPLAADLQRQAARPVTIMMDANTEIGILFASDVVAQGAVAASPAAGNLPAGAAVMPVVAAAPFESRPSTSNFAPIAPATNSAGVAAQSNFSPNFTAPYAPSLPVYTGRSQ